MMEVEIIPMLSDNYSYLLREPRSGVTGVVDPSEATPVLTRLDRLGWTRLDFVLCTHHHWDHIGGNLELKDKTGCQIVGPVYDSDRIPGLDLSVSEDAPFVFGNESISIIFVPGHTRGHIAYWFAQSNLLFTGDTLFSGGCGRLFEGTADQMWTSLQKLRALPKNTKVYCGHEYTEANLVFAQSLAPNDRAIGTHLAKVRELRARNFPTLPSTIEQEMAVNLFFQADSPDLQQKLQTSGMTATDMFAWLRKRKDQF